MRQEYENRYQKNTYIKEDKEYVCTEIDKIVRVRDKEQRI